MRRVRAAGGWFGGADGAPDIPMDTDVVTADDLATYASSLDAGGWFGPCSWYMNHEANAAYSQSVVNDGYLDLPVLFLGGRYDFTCETTTSAMADPMRERCRNLTEHIVDSGHWMAQERPAEVNDLLLAWLGAEHFAL